MTTSSVPTIGVLCIQGDFPENILMLNKISNINILDVRDSISLFKCDGLIIPGGESTSIGVICRDYNLISSLKKFISLNKPIWGICAGLILLSNQLTNSVLLNPIVNNNNQSQHQPQPLIGGLSILTHRNYFGNQNKSSLRCIYVNNIKSMSCFIRSPGIIQILNNNTVNKLAYIYNNNNTKMTVAVEENNILGTVFHPELMNDLYWYQYFVKKVYKSLNKSYSQSITIAIPPIVSNINNIEYGTSLIKTSFPRMLQGGVIMDVVNNIQAKIAEEAGACSVMALERIPADIKSDGGVARMTDPKLIKEIINAVSIPVMAKARIGHFGEAKVLQSIGVDCIDESEVLTAADIHNHINKHPFSIPFVCGACDLGEALRRISEGASMIRLKGNAGTGNVMEAVTHARLTFGEINKLKSMNNDEIYTYAKQISSPIELVKLTKRLGRLPVITFAAGGIATPSDVLLMMELGCDGVFVGSGIFKSGNPRKRARAIVHACTYYKKPNIVAKVSENLGKAMVGKLNKGEKYQFIHHDSKL